MKNTTLGAIDAIIRDTEVMQKQMLWEKVCANSRKIDLLNDKLDLILKKLGDK